jgi:drug/metabolite transporter (DMT)-like permease
MIIGEVIATTVLAWLFAREFISPQKRIGLVLGIVGVVVLTLGGAPDRSYAPNRALGNTFVLLALVCESIFTVLGAQYAQRFQPLTILRWTYTGSMLVWLPVLWWAYTENQIAAAPWEAWGAVVYMAVATSVVSYLLWFWVIRSAGASLGAISLFVQPVVGSLIGLYILAEPQSPGLYFGAALILAAMLVATLADRPPKAPVAADTLTPVPATALVTPVLVIVTAPVALTLELKPVFVVKDKTPVLVIETLPVALVFVLNPVLVVKDKTPVLFSVAVFGSV